jgi:peptidoglycan/LPS O-acetylase OafA/YrhL
VSQNFQKTNSFGIKEIYNFWIRRWFRTLPNYYLVLILNIIVVYFGLINEDLSQFSWKFFLFLQNFSQPLVGFFWESWSLSVEEWFYILFPVILASFYFLFRRFKVSKKYIFLYSIILFLILSFLLRAFYASKFEVDDFWLDVRVFKVVIYRLDGIALGLLAAFIKHWYPSFWHKSRNVSFVLGIIICYVVLYTVWAPNEFITKVFKISFQSIGCFLLLPKFDSMKTAPPLVTKVVTHISLISYSMYLLNLALVAEVIQTNFPPKDKFGAWVLYVVYWIAVIVFSTLLYKYYERPIMNLRDKLKR